MEKAIAIEVTPTSTVAATFAAITRPQCSTTVKVVRPLRWLHSLEGCGRGAHAATPFRCELR